MFYVSSFIVVIIISVCLPSLIHHVTYTATADVHLCHKCSQATLQQSYGVKIRSATDGSPTNKKSPQPIFSSNQETCIYWKHLEPTRNQRFGKAWIESLCLHFWPRHSPNELTRLNEPLSSRRDIWVPPPPCLGSAESVHHGSMGSMTRLS